VRVRIAGPDGTGLGEGAVGEVQVSGAPVTSGYLGDAPATAALFDGCWVRTGDLGFMDGGDLFVAGRLKEMIIVNGRNFFAEDVEAVARQVPGVHRHRCVAVAGHDPEREEIDVIAEVATAGDGEQVRARIARSVAATLDLGAVRVHVVPSDWLPKTTSGKWRRSLARELLRGDGRPGSPG
jgi:fatty-acyl-CoA synthase